MADSAQELHIDIATGVVTGVYCMRCQIPLPNLDLMCISISGGIYCSFCDGILQTGSQAERTSQPEPEPEVESSSEPDLDFASDFELEDCDSD